VTGVGDGVALCFGLRLAAIELDWHLPVAHASPQAAADAAKVERRNERWRCAWSPAIACLLGNFTNTLTA
jgi:hypothetical protein